MISLKELKVKYDPKDGYAPKSGDEKRFRDKHKVQAYPDRNGNGDEVFKASKVDTYDREKEHGYNAGNDQKVYEDVEQATDSIPFGKPYKVKPATVTDKSGAQHNPMSRVKNLARQTLVKMNPKKGGEPITKITPAQGDKVQEEVEESVAYKHETGQRISKSDWKRRSENQHAQNVAMYKAEPEKTFAISHPDVDSGKEKHIKSKHAEYAKNDFMMHHKNAKTPGFNYNVKTYNGLKIRNVSEEVEEVDEVLKPSMGAAAYIKDFVHSDDPKFKGKSKKQRMKQALAAFYSAKRGD